jgi:hypothetical protein
LKTRVRFLKDKLLLDLDEGGSRQPLCVVRIGVVPFAAIPPRSAARAVHQEIGVALPMHSSPLLVASEYVRDNTTHHQETSHFEMERYETWPDCFIS